MRRSKTELIKASILLVVMLFVSSSAAACICSHHQAETHSPHHQIAHEHPADQISEADEANIFGKIDEACICYKDASTFLSNKPENNKTQKNFAVLTEQTEAEQLFEVSENASAKSDYFYHFYNSNYLRKLTPSRAPPRL